MAASAFYPVQYDVVKDFEPISLVSISRLWLVGKIAFPPKDAVELIAWLKANPNRASAASVGTGSAAHICGIHFQNITGTQFQFVFYRGSGPAYRNKIARSVHSISLPGPLQRRWRRLSDTGAEAIKRFGSSTSR